MEENFNQTDDWGEIDLLIRGLKTMLTDIPYEIDLEENSSEGEDEECLEKAKK